MKSSTPWWMWVLLCITFLFWAYMWLYYFQKKEECEAQGGVLVTRPLLCVMQEAIIYD